MWPGVITFKTLARVSRASAHQEDLNRLLRTRAEVRRTATKSDQEPPNTLQKEVLEQET